MIEKDKRVETVWGEVVRLGLLAGLGMLFLAAIGMVETLGAQDIIADVLDVGRFLLFLPPVLASLYVVRRGDLVAEGQMWLAGLVVGLLTAVPLALVVVVEGLLNTADLSLREMFVNISPNLLDIVLYGQPLVLGLVLLLVSSGLLGGLCVGVMLLAERPRRTVTYALVAMLAVGLFGELFTQILRPLFGSGIRTFFSSGSLTPLMAGIVFILGGMAGWFGREQRARQKAWLATQPPKKQKQMYQAQIGLSVLLLIALPWILNTFLSEVMNNVGLYIMMGLGLNIAVGLAGLLDLGYVTNYAVGAYVMGVLTSQPPDGSGLGWSFWAALPVCIVAAMLTGFVFALPVLRMRGDYLAIATLGFGEIIRVLAVSDWLRPVIGGAQGVLYIPKPSVFGFDLRDPRVLYYVILAGCLTVLYVVWRLNNSRTGRKWMAIREDEDVAEAMGINLVRTKVLAFTLSAAAGGLAGGIFAAKLGTVFPQSFNVFVSINVLSVIIVGGMGSIPGIIVGALALIGLPEILREFGEFRQLIYGALLVWMMLKRPEGLVPSAVRRRELNAAQSDSDLPPDEALVSSSTVG